LSPCAPRLNLLRSEETELGGGMGGLADGGNGAESASGERMAALLRRVKEHRIAQWTAENPRKSNDQDRRRENPVPHINAGNPGNIASCNFDTNDRYFKCDHRGKTEHEQMMRDRQCQIGGQCQKSGLRAVGIFDSLSIVNQCGFSAQISSGHGSTEGR
jgi:hypothetical protein